MILIPLISHSHTLTHCHARHTVVAWHSGSSLEVSVLPKCVDRRNRASPTMWVVDGCATSWSTAAQRDLSDFIDATTSTYLLVPLTCVLSSCRSSFHIRHEKKMQGKKRAVTAVQPVQRCECAPWFSSQKLVNWDVNDGGRETISGRPRSQEIRNKVMGNDSTEVKHLGLPTGRLEVEETFPLRGKTSLGTSDKFSWNQLALLGPSESASVLYSCRRGRSSTTDRNSPVCLCGSVSMYSHSPAVKITAELSASP